MTDQDMDETPTDETTPMPKGERIAKVLARAGLCSRREAERWIEDRRVAVNGEVLSSPAFTVTDDDKVMVDGKPLPAKAETKLWRYHKPAGLVTSHNDNEGRLTVFDKMPKHLGRVISVGRLDLNTEGLLLLTNDGELARKLELPSNGWARRYRVRVWGAKVTQEQLDKLAPGVTIDGVRYGPIEAELERQKADTSWIVMTIQEGKNREIRKIMEYLNLQVTRLIRTAYGPFQLGKLKRGDIEEVNRMSVREQLGEKISRVGFAKKKAPAHKPGGTRGPLKKTTGRKKDMRNSGPKATGRPGSAGGPKGRS